GGDFPNWRVNQLRFVRECEKLCQLMEAYADRPYESRPLCFFDGSFAISFAGQLRPERAQPYLRAVRDLLQCSKDTGVPLVGFVDSTYSQDVVTLINTLFRDAAIHQSSDARLFAPVLKNWGDRSPIFVCARPDQLSKNGNAEFYRDVCFSYVNLVTDRPPARVEMPSWLYEKGHAADVLDRVRAECVVGAGYPYVIETADAVAVISQQDRERFYRLFQQFLAEEGINLSLTRKLRSKLTRR
ncbi:MAG: DNA double-strand break repair nuclease NurA, partial [Anaerolineae bacterium]|nr:DNA double-strand break repair nuclease NurA [Anaerolineae bacterium]